MGVIFNDAVVYKGNSITRYVGVRVSRGRLAMRGPSRMRHTATTDNRVERVSIFQRFYFSQMFMHLKRMTVIDQGHARGVITSILEPSQALEQNFRDFSLSCRGNYSTHNKFLLLGFFWAFPPIYIALFCSPDGKLRFTNF